MWKFAKVTSAKNAIFAVFQFLVVFAELTFTFELLKNFKKSDEKELTSGSRSGKISKQIERGAAEKAATRETLKRKRKNILKKVLKTLDRSGSDVVR